MFVIRLSVPIPNPAKVTEGRHELNVMLYRLRVPWLICEAYQGVAMERIKQRVADIIGADVDDTIYHVQPVLGDDNLLVEVVNLLNGERHVSATETAKLLALVVEEEVRLKYKEFYEQWV